MKMIKKTDFLSTLKEELAINNQMIDAHNFEAFLEDFEYSQKKSDSQRKKNIKEQNIHNLENILMQKAHNLKIYHNDSGEKNDKNVIFSQKYEKSPNFPKKQKNEKKSEIYQKNGENIFFDKNEEIYTTKENKDPILIEENEKSEFKQKDLIWKRLQDDKKTEKIQRELIKKQNEEKNVYK